MLHLTSTRSPPLLPEITLHLASDDRWLDPEALAREHGVGIPYWAVAWAGGIALARYLLDHPATVHGKHVVDFGAGSGVVAIAAAMAGAQKVTAVDVDPMAHAAIAANAERNRVMVHIANTIPEADLVCAADVLYDRDDAPPLFAQLRALPCPVLLAHSGRPWHPREHLEELASYHAITHDRFDDDTLARVRVFALR